MNKKTIINICPNCINHFYYQGIIICSLKLKDAKEPPPQSAICEKVYECEWLREIKKEIR